MIGFESEENINGLDLGGSTLLVLFEPGVMQWDDDLIDNSNGALETLVSHNLRACSLKLTLTQSKIRVGMSVGHSSDSAAHTADMKKTNPTNEEKQDAKRRIEGSLAPTAGAVAVSPH